MRYLKRRHLRRLDAIYDQGRAPIFFLTCCVQDRAPVLANSVLTDTLVSAWEEGGTLYGWLVGRYVIMPDHVHFFAAPVGDEAKDLSRLVNGWKRWTARQIRRGMSSFAWQPEFFDHLLRSEESYQEKWDYVRANPVRAGLVSASDDWPYQGEVHGLAM